MTTTVSAHEQGFHKRITFTITKYAIDGLLVMDVDGGDRCKLLRAGADTNHDGVLAGAEVTALKQRLTTMMTRALKLSISGGALPLGVKDTKLSLHEDPRVNESGVSIAVLLEIVHPYDVSPGMNLEVTDTSPDLSPIRLEVFQKYTAEASPEQPFRGDDESGAKSTIRLGALAAR